MPIPDRDEPEPDPELPGYRAEEDRNQVAAATTCPGAGSALCAPVYSYPVHRA
jgi:hypothetical protein